MYQVLGVHQRMKRTKTSRSTLGSKSCHSTTTTPTTPALALATFYLRVFNPASPLPIAPLPSPLLL